jgi:hypothetical protein
MCSNGFLNNKYINKSVYWKNANNVYFYKNKLYTIYNIDYQIIPLIFMNGNTLKNENQIVKIFVNSWKENDSEPCQERNIDSCNYQKLLNYIITFYTQLQIAYNYINSNKCTCYNIKIEWKNIFDINFTKKKINIFEAHDLFVYLFTHNSQFYNFFLICSKLQKYLYSNFKARDNCYIKIESNYNNNCKNVINC